MINVIIPCYNSRETLPNTLNSLVAQTQKRFLVTIVDDCSDEDYIDIINEYKKKLHIGFLKTEKNSGPGAARQLGIDKNISCEYLLFLDSDDMLMPQAIEVLNRESHIHKPDILISGFIRQNKYGVDEIIHSTDSTTWIHGKLYKSSYLEENNIRFPDGLRVNEDGAFNLMAYGMTDNIYRTSVITMIWIDNKNSMTRKNNDFLVNCIPDYIKGQTYAYSFLLDNNRKDYMSIAAGLSYIYSYYEIAVYNKYNMNEEIHRSLKKYLKRLEKEGLLKDKTFIKLLKEYLLKENKSRYYYYFKTHTFLQWLSLYGVTIDENNID